MGTTSPNAHPEAQRKKLIKLPDSVIPRSQRPVHFCQLITGVTEAPFTLMFQGRMHAPGSLVDAANLPKHPVIVEHCGWAGLGRRDRNRLYIVWRYDWQLEEWLEVARTMSPNWTYVLNLRESVLDALHYRPELIDVLDRSRDLTGRLMGNIDDTLAPEIHAVRVNVLTAVHDEVAGRIAFLDTRYSTSMRTL